ncbi:tryptophan synthase subunit alpha [Candidatus Micrarchaeota archaeon]|nr:tryptophan synthase subunit alpha [Candidatus Micrarchaeota archaeon]
MTQKQTRTTQLFARLKKENRSADFAAFMPYVCAGDPNPNFTKKLIRTLVENGAHAIEMGIPFSDPVADGSTIQKASQRALKAGMTPDKAIDLISELRTDGIEVPIIVMSYYNLVFVNGQDEFVRKIKKAGADGLIVPDVPLEESDELERICKRNGIDLIYLIAPTTTNERLYAIIKRASGFLYIVAVAGTTGARENTSKAAIELISKVKGIRKDIPVVVGFGVSKAEHAKEYAKAGADGVIVGSKITDICRSEGIEEKALIKIAKFTKEMKE